MRAKFEVVVVGSGHAGVEAALASARIGCLTLMVTQNLDTIAQMSCNPAIGGPGKGQLVREIDAMGGAMGLNADATGIQFRMLNKRKGPSARAPRVQCDKKAYQFRMKAVLERTPNLFLEQATVSEVLVEKGRAVGIKTDLGRTMYADAIVITSGTFLGAILHMGENSKRGGRMADLSSNLSDSLGRLGFEIKRFKTGTPCRINGRSIDFSACEAQTGDAPAPRLSFRNAIRGSKDIFTLNFDDTGKFHVEQLPCWLTHTTAETNQIVRANLHSSPLYAGRLSGIGPRYCPSIEDKVVKFSEKTSHPVFLEPEGRHTEEFYVNGISTSLPPQVQEKFVHSIPGLHNAEILRPGYAVEYDYFPPTQLRHTLETKLLAGLYFAGQINGTSGYEEAAAQGLVAGANAALKLQQRPALALGRDDALMGVLVDDLVTKGTEEPYRMFTSRSDDRLKLRHDNAEERLTALALRSGLVCDQGWVAFQTKQKLIEELKSVATKTHLGGTSLARLFRHADFTARDLPAEIKALAPLETWEFIETEFKYAGYTARQNRQNLILANSDQDTIPSGFDFTGLRSLRSETREKLAAIRPRSLGQASRISGVTAADVAVLYISLKTKS